jgi:hypothetical protein
LYLGCVCCVAQWLDDGFQGNIYIFSTGPPSIVGTCPERTSGLAQISIFSSLFHHQISSLTIQSFLLVFFFLSLDLVMFSWFLIFFYLDLLYSFDFFLILSFNPNLACINFFPLWSSFFYFIYFFLNPFVQFLLIFNFIPQSKFMVHCFFFQFGHYSFDFILFLLKLFFFSISPFNKKFVVFL